MLFQNSKQAVWIADPKTGSFIAVNSAALEFYGYTEKQFLSLNIKDITGESAFDVLDKEVKQTHLSKNKSSVKVNAVYSELIQKNKKVIIAAVSPSTGIEDEVKNRMRIFSQISEAVMLSSPDDKIIFWNNEAEEIYGYTAGEVIGKTSAEVFRVSLPDPKERKIIESTLKSNGKWKSLNVHHKKNGEPIFVESISSQFTADNSGAESEEYVLTIIRNITSRVKAEEEIRRSREELNVILRNVSDGITVQNSSGRLVYANDAAAQLCGYATAMEFRNASGTELLSKFHIMDENGFPFPLERLPGRLALKGIPNASTVVRFKILETGEERWAKINSTPVFDEDGDVRLAINIFHDITDERNAAEMLKISEMRFRLLFEQSPLSTQIISPDGTTLQVNNAWEKLFGASMDDLKDYNILHDQQLAETGTLDLIKKVLTGEASFLPPIKYYPSQGKYKDNELWLQAYIYPVKNINGSIRELVLIHENITERKQAEQKFETEYKLRRGIEDSIPEGIAIVDLQGKITYVNPAFCRIISMDEKDLINKYPPYSYWPEEEAEKINSALQQMLRGEAPPEGFDLKFKTGKGNLIDVHISVSPIKDESNNTISWLCSISDITDRKKTERELESILKELSDYRYALDVSSIVAITDQKGIIKYANNNFLKISKYSYNELVGQDHRIVNSGYHSKEFIRNLWRTIASGNIWKGELRNRAKDGSIYWVETTIVPFLDENNKPYQYVAIRSDITQRKLSEEILRKSEEKYRTLVEGTNAVLFTTNLHGIFTYANEAASNLLNLPMDKILGKFYLKFVHKEDRQKVHEHFIKKTLVEEKSSYLEFRYTNGNDKEGWVSFLVNPLIENGVFTGITGIAQDITQRKQVEKKIADSLKEKETLLKEVHHRVKNNMQIIYSLLNLQSGSIEDQSVLNIVKESQNRIRIMALLHEKLYQSKEISYIDLPGYIKEIIKNVVSSYILDMDKIKVDVDIDEFEVSIDAAISIGLIINELISNAVKYAFPAGRKGRVRFLLKKNDNASHKMIISDNGVGFPSSINFKNTSSLGLQLVNTLVNQIEGSIQMNNSEGTEFIIIFPSEENKVQTANE